MSQPITVCCNCAHVSPTMPTCRDWHLPTCPFFLLQREFLCKHCRQPAPDEWGADRRCPQYPETNLPPYMRSCEFVRGA